MTCSAASAYARVLPELLALDAASVIPITVNVNAAVATARKSLARIRAHRRAMQRLGGCDVVRPDRVELYARALTHACSACDQVRRDPDDIRGPYEAALRLRGTLHGDVVALIRRGLIPEEAMAGYRALRGFENVAGDLELLVRVLKQNRERIHGRCATRPIEITRAAVLASRVRIGLERRDQGSFRIDGAADLRARCFTLFARAYDEIRRAVVYLRWHEGDADDIAPSIYAARRKAAAS